MHLKVVSRDLRREIHESQRASLKMARSSSNVGIDGGRMPGEDMDQHRSRSPADRERDRGESRRSRDRSRDKDRDRERRRSSRDKYR